MYIKIRICDYLKRSRSRLLRNKQFTGMGIALLAREGKINLDEDIHKYLSWVPDFKEKITLRHLLHHTSGIRDHLIMSILGGTRSNGLLTQDIATKYIKNYDVKYHLKH